MPRTKTQKHKKHKTRNHVYKMDPMKPWTFRVRCEVVGRGEVVCVTGDSPELGKWKHDKPIIMKRDIEDPNIWKVTMSLSTKHDVRYRYLLCIPLDATHGDFAHRQAFIMRKWETFITPRIIKRKDLNSADRKLELFGIGENEILANIDNGWLTEEKIIQLKITENSVQIWKKRFKTANIRMKLVAIDLRRPSSASIDLGDSNSADIDSPGGYKSDYEESTGWPVIEVSVINKDQYSFRNQPQFGTLYDKNEMMVFQVQLFDVSSLAYMVDFYAENENYGGSEIPPTHIGFSHILPFTLRNSFGSIILPIQSSSFGGAHRPVGQIVVDYLVVLPMRQSLCDLSISYCKHWKNNWTGLDVGHRGMGNSNRNSIERCTTVMENTIRSLDEAGASGADFVEFDVQLSKDLVPVLFHDFHVNIGLNKKAKIGGASTHLSIPVKDLTLDQLQHLKGHVYETHSICNGNFDSQNKIIHANGEVEHHEPNDDSEDPFPTLQRALEIIDGHVGFNVEIKWSMQLKDGSWELENPLELNLFIDIVLEIVLKYGGLRKIVFSCFHPDICLMIRYKQNKYPVLFLTQGVTDKYPAYNDPRTRNIPVAVYYALSAGILGLSIHTEDILRDPSQIKEVTSHGLVAFCWGDENNDSANIRRLKELGLNGVIYDRIQDHIEKDKKGIFLIESAEELQQLAESVSASASAQSSNAFGFAQSPPNGSSTVQPMETNGHGKGHS